MPIHYNYHSLLISFIYSLRTCTIPCSLRSSFPIHHSSMPVHFVELYLLTMFTASLPFPDHYVRPYRFVMNFFNAVYGFQYSLNITFVTVCSILSSSSVPFGYHYLFFALILPCSLRSSLPTHLRSLIRLLHSSV